MPSQIRATCHCLARLAVNINQLGQSPISGCAVIVAAFYSLRQPGYSRREPRRQLAKIRLWPADPDLLRIPRKVVIV